MNSCDAFFSVPGRLPRKCASWLTQKMTKSGHESNNRVTVGEVFPAAGSPLIGLCCHRVSLSCKTVKAVNLKKGVVFGARESYQHSYFSSNKENSYQTFD